MQDHSSSSLRARAAIRVQLGEWTLGFEQERGPETEIPAISKRFEKRNVVNSTTGPRQKQVQEFQDTRIINLGPCDF